VEADAQSTSVASSTAGPIAVLSVHDLDDRLRARGAARINAEKLFRVGVNKKPHRPTLDISIA
jgi:hypothetical protein